MQAFLILLGSWIFGIGIFGLWLENEKGNVSFENTKSALMISGALGVVAAFFGMKANLSFWMVWIVYAAAGAFVAYQMLKRKQTAGVYGRGISAEDKKDTLVGLLNVAIFVCFFILTILIGNSGSPWLLFVTTPLFTAIAAWIMSPRKDLSVCLGWGVIGLFAGIGFYYAI